MRMRRSKEFAERLGDLPADLERGRYPALVRLRDALARSPKASPHAPGSRFSEPVPIESGQLNVTAIGFQGFIVPASERWRVFAIGSMTDTLDADQTLRLQTAIRFLSGQAYATDVAGVAAAGAAGQSNRGGVGFYPPGGIVIPPRYGVGVNIAQVTVGAAGSVQIFISVLRQIETV